MEEFDGYPVRRGFAGPGWQLEDCEALAGRYPDTFKLPSKAARARARVGSLVRLHFIVTDPEVTAEPGNPRAERMWVEVCEMSGNGAMLGHLTNEPACIESLEPGDVIEFLWRHVAQVESPRS